MNKNKFQFTYSAPTKTEREEIEDIRKNYLPEDEKESKLKKLKKLDEKVKNIPTMWSLCLGIGGVLIFGLGLTMILEWNLVALGVIIDIISCVPMGLAYFVYNRLKTKLTQKYKDEILALSEELLNEDK